MLFRSIFWLSLAFVVIRPGVDVGAGMEALSREALAAGQQVLFEQVAAGNCLGARCPDGTVLLAAGMQMLSTGSALTQDDQSQPVPLPRPRPEHH